MIERDHNEEVIILKDRKEKDGKKPRIEYVDTPETISLRTHVRMINDFLSRHVINLSIPDKELEALAKDLGRDPNKYPVDFTRTRLKRIFNNGSFEQGGRFYGGWWLEIPKAYRNRVTINGKRTIEIDYGALHPRLLYAQEGLHYPADEDPYSVPIAGVPRDAIKRIFNILLNAESHAEAIGAIKDKYPTYSEQQLLEAIEAIKRVHHPIARHLHSGVGVKLQYSDSILAQAIIIHMMEHHGILVLPVHDSFIVRVGFEDELRETMEERFQAMFTNKPVLKPDPVEIKDPHKEPDDAATDAAEVRVDEPGLNEYFDEYAKEIQRNEWLRKRAERQISKGPVTPIIHTKR
jgi:hypothetical protein